MKKALLLALVAATLSQSCAQKLSDAISNASADFSGKPVETKEFALGDFNAIATSAAIKVTVVKSNTRKIVIKSNAMPFVEAKVSGGKLSVHYNNSGTSLNNTNTEATVFTPDFNELGASSAAKIKVDDAFHSGRLSISLSSAASITGTFEADNINIDASSAAHFSGKIKAENLNLDASSSAHIEAEGYAKNVDADASSTAKINLENLKYSSIQRDESSMGKIVTR